jgi:hypothetical protein
MTAPTYIAMILKAEDGTETPVWQKSEVASQTVVTAWATTYVDANGDLVDLPATYEMTVVDGHTLNAPGA